MILIALEHAEVVENGRKTRTRKIRAHFVIRDLYANVRLIGQKPRVTCTIAENCEHHHRLSSYSHTHAHVLSENVVCALKVHFR